MPKYDNIQRYLAQIYIEIDPDGLREIKVIGVKENINLPELESELGEEKEENDD